MFTVAPKNFLMKLINCCRLSLHDKCFCFSYYKDYKHYAQYIEKNTDTV